MLRSINGRFVEFQDRSAFIGPVTLYVRSTFIGITTGLANLLSFTASFIIYLLIGGSNDRIVLYLGSCSSIVAVKPSNGFLGSAAVTKSNTFLKVVALSLTKCTSSNMIMLELLIRSRLLIALWYVLIVISRTSLRSPKYAPNLSRGIPYLISLLIFCSTRTIRGTRKRILNELFFMS